MVDCFVECCTRRRRRASLVPCPTKHTHSRSRRAACTLRRRLHTPMRQQRVRTFVCCRCVSACKARGDRWRRTKHSVSRANNDGQPMMLAPRPFLPQENSPPTPSSPSHPHPIAAKKLRCRPLSLLKPRGQVLLRTLLCCVWARVRVRARAPRLAVRRGGGAHTGGRPPSLPPAASAR